MSSITESNNYAASQQTDKTTKPVELTQHSIETTEPVDLKQSSIETTEPVDLKTTPVDEQKTTPVEKTKPIHTALKKAVEWFDEKACDKIEELVSGKIGFLIRKRKLDPENPDVEMNIFDVSRVMAQYLNVHTTNDEGKVNWNEKVLPFNTSRESDEIGFSFNTVVRGGFMTRRYVKGIDGKKTTVDQLDSKLFRDAGIVPYLGQRLKKMLNSKGIKVMDISDPDKSNKIVFKVTIFPFEQNFKDAFPFIFKKKVYNRRNNYNRNDDNSGGGTDSWPGNHSSYSSRGRSSRGGRSSRDRSSRSTRITYGANEDNSQKPSFKNELTPEYVPDESSKTVGKWVQAAMGNLKTEPTKKESTQDLIDNITSIL